MFACSLFCHKGPKIRSHAHDEADHKALKMMTKRRVQWSAQEDSVIMLCSVALHLLNSKVQTQIHVHLSIFCSSLILCRVLGWGSDVLYSPVNKWDTSWTGLQFITGDNYMSVNLKKNYNKVKYIFKKTLSES